MGKRSKDASPAFSLDAVIQQQVAKSATPARAYAFVLLRRLEASGLKVLPGDRARVQRRLEKTLKRGRVDLPISDRRLKALGLSTKDLKQKLEEPISEAEFAAFTEVMSSAVQVATQKAVQALAVAHGRYVAETGRDILEEHRALREAFLYGIHCEWGDALASYEIFVEIAREVGSVALARAHLLSSGPDAIPHKIEAIARIYGRACQIAGEIGALLDNGYADGAQARWRSLHEIQVVLSILANGDDRLSERYLCHHDIDLYREAKASYPVGQKRSHKITERQMLRLEEARNALITHFGKDFGGQYGWAAEIMGFQPNFSQLEERAGAAYLRSNYKGASANIHASARGVLTRLGQPRRSLGVLAGASNFGFATPAIEATHSLLLCGITFALVSNSADVMAKAIAMQKLQRQLADQFRSSAKALRASACTQRKAAR